MYLSKISIHNYKGIEFLEAVFSSKINVIIGENGACKSALIDAIRLLYNIGEPLRDLTVLKEDFHEKVYVDSETNYTISQADTITISYEFRDLSAEQKGAFYEYMVVDTSANNDDFARIELSYKKDKRNPVFSYSTGNIEGQKADYNTFQLFQHYYLSALRDSTKDLLSTRGNLLGKVIKRLVDRNKSEDEIKNIIKEANGKLLVRPEVSTTRDNINANLDNIFKNVDQSQIGLHIEQSKIEYIVNVIKPYLPHDWQNKSEEGFQLWQNSLGFNNLIYIATVLGDIKERIKDDPIPHFALLIEEPEAHIHPQLQLSLYNFLKEANASSNSQLFITTHSPTLTSKVPFTNLIALEDKAFTIHKIFEEREKEKLIQDTTKTKYLGKDDIDFKRKQLQRYVDVTKSQLFYAKSCLFVEGISEELLISSFCLVKGFNLEDYRIELVNVGGVSFYPFMFLFNSSDSTKRLPKKIAILTDDDRYPASKNIEYKFENLVADNHKMHDALHVSLTTSSKSNRVNNLVSIANNQPTIVVKSAFQTLEFDLCLSNVLKTKNETENNFLYRYLNSVSSVQMITVNTYLSKLGDDLTETEREKIAILMWKSMPGKSAFAQEFSLHIMDNIDDAKKSFIVPEYINEAFIHLKA